jgi:hypothetical protein
MILDQITLAGPDAYLRGPGATEINVAALTPQTFPEAGLVRRARSLEIGEGMLVEVSGVQLYLEHPDLFSTVPRRAESWITVRVEKEMFRGLYKNPYARRTHRIGGFEDFSRGSLRNLRAMEVEGVATLVSTGDDDPCGWRSAIYTMPAKLPIDAVAWDIPTHRTTPADSFSYDLKLLTWTSATPSGPPQVTPLATGANPQTPRFFDIDPLIGATHYQVQLDAVVRHDAPLRERHLAEVSRESLGRPLLSAVYLLEVVPNAFAFNSLAELLAQASDAQLFASGTEPPRRCLVNLDLGATLSKGESIVIDVHDQSGLAVVQARLIGNIMVRPPRTEGRI